jgi:hypothetical protein
MLESKPDALPDDVRARLEWADKAEQMLHDILSALGYRARVTPAELLAAIVVWLESVRRMRVDPAGNIATFWARAFDRAFHRSPMATTKAATEEATEAADFAVDEFARRFPPLLEDASDDLEALREERDAWQAEAEGLRKISDAAEERAETAERNERIALDRLTEQARIAIVAHPKPERVAPGQRWALTADVVYVKPNGYVTLDDGGVTCEPASSFLGAEQWVFLGTEPSVFDSLLGPAPTTEG